MFDAFALLAEVGRGGRGAGHSVVRRDIQVPVATNSGQTALAVDPPLARSDFTSPQPVDVFIRRALIENRTVLAVRFNLAAIRERIPQAKSLEDPMLSNTIWPFPSNSPQYSLMGYMPWDTRTCAAIPMGRHAAISRPPRPRTPKSRLEELAAAEMDAVMNVRKSYLDLYYSQRSVTILSENRTLAVDILDLRGGCWPTARRLAKTCCAVEVAVAGDVDPELIAARPGLVKAAGGPCAAVARQSGDGVEDLGRGRDRQRAGPDRGTISFGDDREAGVVVVGWRRWRGIKRRSHWHASDIIPTSRWGSRTTRWKRRTLKLLSRLRANPTSAFCRIDVADLLQKDGCRRSRGAGRMHADAMLYESEFATRPFEKSKTRRPRRRAQGDTLALFREIILPKSDKCSNRRLRIIKTATWIT